MIHTGKEYIMASSKAKNKGKGRGGFNQLRKKEIKFKEYVKTLNRIKTQNKSKLESTN